eukprot:gene17088-biopygen17273
MSSFSSAPALAITLQPRAFRIWMATDPTAPVPADTNAVSPSFGSAIFWIGRYAESPVSPRTPKKCVIGTPSVGCTRTNDAVSTICRFLNGSEAV